MNQKIRNILLLAMVQDVLILVATLALAGSVPATHTWLIVAGQSHHLAPEASRRALNQSQHTIGIEVSRGPWIAQISHMEDSFGCSSNELAVARRWQFVHAHGITGGFMLGAMAAHRCAAFPALARTELVALYRAESIQTSAAGTFVSCNYDAFPPLAEPCTLYSIKTTPARGARWVFGLAPGFYLDLGDRVRLEATLIRSPWTGHHIVAYAQLLLRLATFK